VRALERIDELQRKIVLDALAIAFGASALAVLTYGFLENVGLPHVNWMWVWPVMAAFWILGSWVAKRRYR